MTMDDVLFIGQDAIMTTLLAAAPMLIAGMAVGLTISILQSVTQIQEITLTFVPKIIAVLVTFVLFIPWMVSVVMGFVQPLFGNINELVK